jgi:hypothetical protein
VTYFSGKANAVADCLTRQYEEPQQEPMFSGLLLGQLPEAVQSIQEHQRKDTFCRTIYQKFIQEDRDVRNFKLLNGALIYHPSRAHGKHYLLPESLRPMVLEYFQSSALSAHLGMTKTLNRIAKVFYWPDMRREVCAFVSGCQECQRAKPAQHSKVGLHSSEVVTRPLERIFIDFVGRLSEVAREILPCWWY